MKFGLLVLNEKDFLSPGAPSCPGSGFFKHIILKVDSDNFLKAELLGGTFQSHVDWRVAKVIKEIRSKIGKTTHFPKK